MAGNRALGVALTFAALGCTPRGTTAPAAQIDQGWYAGGATCTGPQFQVRAFDRDLFILRQAACTNYEKPFLYLIFGSERALLLDTGAGKVDLVTPIDSLIRRRQGSLELVVAHSHAHGD